MTEYETARGATVHRVCDRDDVPANGMIPVRIDGLPEILVVNIDGEFFAMEDLCTHAIGVLSEGTLKDGIVYCPIHGGGLCVKTGEAVQKPCKTRARTYPVSLQDGQVCVDLAESGQSVGVSNAD